MMLTYDLPAAAGRLFAVLSAHTDPHAGEAAELRTSGVSAATVAALYPFDVRNHLPAIVAALREPNVFAAATVTFRNAEASISCSVAEITGIGGQVNRWLWHLPGNELPPGHRPLVAEWGLLLLFLSACAGEPADRHEYGSLLAQRFRVHQNRAWDFTGYLRKPELSVPAVVSA